MDIVLALSRRGVGAYRRERMQTDALLHMKVVLPENSVKGIMEAVLAVVLTAIQTQTDIVARMPPLIG